MPFIPSSNNAIASVLHSILKWVGGKMAFGIPLGSTCAVWDARGHVSRRTFFLLRDLLTSMASGSGVLKLSNGYKIIFYPFISRRAGYS